MKVYDVFDAKNKPLNERGACQRLGYIGLNVALVGNCFGLFGRLLGCLRVGFLFLFDAVEKSQAVAIFV